MISVTADNCTISSLGVEAGGYNSGIKVRGNNTTVEYCNVNSSLIGIYITESQGNTVHNCTVWFCGHGMQIASSYDNEISDCRFDYNYGDGVNFWLGYSNTLRRCETYYNEGSGFYLYWLSMDNRLTDCGAFGNEHGFYVFDCDRLRCLGEREVRILLLSRHREPGGGVHGPGQRRGRYLHEVLRGQ